MQSTRGTVTTAATLLVSGPQVAEGVRGLDALVRVPSSGGTVSIGGSAVTTSTGFDVLAGETVSANVDPGEGLYGIVASGTQVVHVLTSISDD